MRAQHATSQPVRWSIIVSLHLVTGAAITICVAWYVALRGSDLSPWSFDTVAVEGRQISGAPTEWGVPRFAAEGSDFVYSELRVGFSSLADRRLPTSRRRSYGWPARAFVSEDHFIDPKPVEYSAAGLSWDSGIPIPGIAWEWKLASRKSSTHLPIKPLWTGLAVDSVVFAIILSGFSIMCGRLRGRSRLRRGMCPRCAYPIGTSPNCTECGRPLPRQVIQMRMPEGTAPRTGTFPEDPQSDRGVA